MSVSDIKANIGKYEDFTKTADAKTRDIIPAGKTVCRLVEYIDLGVQPQRPYQGQPKKPADTFKLTFELLGPKNIHVIQTDEGEKKFADKVFLTLTKSTSPKSKCKKLFTKLVYNRPGITHFAHMLGDAFIVEMSHSQFTNPMGKVQTYANPTVNGEYSFGAPLMEDPMTGEVKTLDVPAALSSLKCFAWSLPSMEDWNSLYIDGVYTNKEGKEVSKNFIQEAILNAVNFEGSPTDLMLQERQVQGSNLSEATDALVGVVG